MKKHFGLLFCLFLIGLASGQTPTIKIKKGKFVPAVFPGGKNGIDVYMYRKIDLNLQRRMKARDSIEFKAQIEINEAGIVTKATLLRGSIDRHMDSIFISALEQMPSWTPAVDEKGNNCRDKQFVSYNPALFGIPIFRNGSLQPGRLRNSCRSPKQDFDMAQGIVGMIEDSLYVDSINTGIVLCRVLVADKREYVDSKVLVVVQQCNWNKGYPLDIIPGCYNCDMRVLTEKPARFKDIKWQKYHDSGYRKFYLLDDDRAVKNAQVH